MSWLNFLDKKTKSDNDQNAFIKYSTKIAGYSLESANILRKIWDLNQTQWFAILFEFLYLYLNLTDRAIFGNLDNEKRDKTMLELERMSTSSLVEAVCYNWPEDKIKKIKEECMNNYRVSMEEWGKCNRDTLFSEFSKEIAKLSGNEHNPECILQSLELAATSLENFDLNLKLFIESIK